MNKGTTLDRDGDGYIVPLPVQAFILFIQIFVNYLSNIWKYIVGDKEKASED